LQQIGLWVERLARWIAILGGFVLVTIALVTVVSVTGRSLNDFGLGSIRGDFELVEAGTAFAVCAFLPWCQLRRAHAAVAIFTDFMGDRVNRVLDLLGDGLLLAAALVMTWRHTYGFLDKLAFNETTFILRYPIWWAYAGALVGLVTWIVVAAWCTANSVQALNDPERARERQAETYH